MGGKSMKSKFNIPKLPKIKWKSFIAIIIIIFILATVIKCAPNFLSRGDKKVGYEVLEARQIPDKIQEILPRYKMLERALAAKVDEDIYVIVTRGEKLSGGYDIEIEKIQVLKENREEKIIVHALFKDPKDDDLVTQAITYPYIVARTSLKDLPRKIELKVNYNNE